MEKASDQKKDKGKGESTENPVEIININTPPDNPTFKRLIRQLKDARKEVVPFEGRKFDWEKKDEGYHGHVHETLNLA
jgi:hypothetical protein